MQALRRGCPADVYAYAARGVSARAFDQACHKQIGRVTIMDKQILRETFSGPEREAIEEGLTVETSGWER